MATSIKKLLEFEIPTIKYGDVRKNVENRMDNAAKMDEIDTVTFGLQTDDGEIIKIYVDVADSDKFEQSLSELYASDISIEDMINRLAADYNIVDVVWPDESDVDDEEETGPDRGSESLNTEINQDDIQEQDTITGNTDLTYGQSVAKRLLGESVSGVGGGFALHHVLALLKDIGLPDKVIKDNDVNIHKILRKYVNDVLPNNLAAMTAIRLYVSSIGSPKKKNVSEAVADLPNVSTGELSQYFSNKYQDLIYSIFAKFGIDDDLLTRKGNKDLVVDSVINAGSKLKNEPKKFALLKDVYDALVTTEPMTEEMDMTKYLARGDAAQVTMDILNRVLCIPEEIIQKCPALTSYLLSAKRDSAFKKVYQNHHTVISALMNSMKTEK